MQISEAQRKFMKKYYEMLYPMTLQKTEYIRLSVHGKNSDGTAFQRNEFVKDFEEYIAVIEKYIGYCDIFNALSTVRIRSKDGKPKGTEFNQVRRQVLFLDFDKKDYPQFGNDIYQFTNLIKSRFPDLFLHAYYNSGGGFHYYVSVKRTNQIRDLVTLNKEIAQLVGADTNACKVTQIARVPATFNRKEKYRTEDGKFPMVVEVDHYSNHQRQVAQYHPLNLAYISRSVNNVKNKYGVDALTQQSVEQWDYSGDGYNIPQYDCLCTERVLHEGADEHERNTWLGRIIALYIRKKYTRPKITEMCIEWNTKCRPPKTADIIKAEVDGWFEWIEKNGAEHLSGCWQNMPEGDRAKAIVERKCDVIYCRQQQDGYNSLSVSPDAGVKMNQKVLGDNNLKNKGKSEISGYEYLVLTVLEKQMPKEGRKPFTVNNLKYRLQWKSHGKWQLCMDEKTLKKTLNALEEHRCITLKEAKAQVGKKKPTYDDTIIKMAKRLSDFETKGFIEFFYSAARAFICHQITQTEYKVLLCLIRNMKNRESCTLDNLSNSLNMDKGNIVKAIQALDQAQCIKVIKLPTESGKEYNNYKLTDTNKYDSDTDIGLTEEEFNDMLIKIIA